LSKSSNWKLKIRKKHELLTIYKGKNKK
jgi:hypothetical protein